MPGDLDHDSPDPLYAQLAGLLREAIADGTYPVRLPAEAELEEIYGVSRDTVRRAVFVLSREGIVRVSPGRGTFVIRRDGVT